MISYHCDGCGREIGKNALRYTVQIDVRAAYDKLEIGLADLVRDHRAELLALIEKLKNKSPTELEEGVYKSLRLDLCPSCQKIYIRNPLRFHPEQTAPSGEINIDEFLRSLGLGGGPAE
jgi:hypothetical protein